MKHLGVLAYYVLRASVLFWLSIGFSHSLFAQQKEQRVALVIGNSAYKAAPLRNPVNDATDMAQALREAGFVVTLRTNIGTRDMRQAIRTFSQTLKQGGVGLFYFAGHGIQSKGRNYLVPLNADIKEEFELEDEAVDANRVLAGMEEAGNRVNIVVLDACRDNPFARSWRSSSSGLAQLSAPNGSFVVFATAPGSVAADGLGRNGVFTRHLLASLKHPDSDIDRVFTRVAAGVARESNKKQVPWKSSSLTGEFRFSGAVQVGSVPAAPEMSEAQREDAFWVDAKAVGNREAFEGYLESYPKGRYASLARANIARLAAGSTQVVGAPTATTPTRPQPVPAPSAQPLAPQAGTSFKDCDECPEMVMLPAGTFLMGSKADPVANSQPGVKEQPQHSVTIRAFAIGKFEVTQEQWFALMGTLPSKFKGRTLPVEPVSWSDAQAFVQKLSAKTGKTYRLPSEAEWEYAARAASQTNYSFGDKAEPLGRYAWSASNASATTHPVGEKLPNAFGLHDMLGNVWEWTEDCWNGSYNGAPNDGSAWTAGDCSQRVVRGGAWSRSPGLLRIAFHSPAGTLLHPPADRFDVFRFRVARTN